MNVEKDRSLILLHLGTLLLGGTALFSKLIHLSAVEITLSRGIIGVLTLAAVLSLTRTPLKLDSRGDYGLAILLGLLFTIHWITYFQAIQVSTVAIGVVALFTFPVMTVFLEPVFTRQKPQRSDIICAVIVLLGIYLMVPNFSLTNSTLQGIGWGLLSAFVYSLRNVLQRHYFIHYKSQTTMFYQALIVALVLLPVFPRQFTELGVNQWLLILLLGTVFSILPHTIIAHSLIRLSAKSIGLITCLQVGYASLLAALFLHEYPSAMTMLGGGLITATAVYESFKITRVC